jgi:hypothetical protein
MTQDDCPALHFVTFVGFGFVYGCATILWLKNAEVMVGIPSIYRPPSCVSAPSCSDVFFPLSMVPYL